MEFIAASAISTVVGGVVLLMMSSIRAAYQTHTAFTQLSGYLDSATTVLRNDIWQAVNSCLGTNCPPGTSGTAWLALDLPTSAGATGWGGAGPDVRYTIEGTNLVRRVWNGAGWPATGWTVAQFIVPASTTASVNSGLVTLNLWTRRTVNGRQYTRQVTGLIYRLAQ